MSSQGLVDGFMRGLITGGKSNGSTITTTIPGRSERVVDVAKEKAYDLFLRLVDPVSAKKLRELDNKIYSISSGISKKTGWSMKDEHFVLLEHEDTPFVIHCYDGYESTSNDENRVIEEQFIRSNQSDLMKLHQAYFTKEAILGGGYTVKDENASGLARELTRFLGISKETITQKIK